MTIDALREQIESVSPVDEREAESIEKTLDRLTWPGDPFDEFAHAHHLTASAFVVSSRGIVLHLHKRLGIWVQPGGHVDSGESPEEACLRETAEETGLVARHFEPVTLFHVDVHRGPSDHTHYDLRYVVASEPLDPTPPEGESPEVYWFDFDAAAKRAQGSLSPGLFRKLADSSHVRGVTN